MEVVRGSAQDMDRVCQLLALPYGCVDLVGELLALAAPHVLPGHLVR